MVEFKEAIMEEAELALHSEVDNFW